MPKRALVGTFLTTVALALLLSFRTPDTAGLAAPAPANGAGSTSATRGTYSGQLTGSTVQTPFGNVQVQVSLQNGQITDVQTLQLPSGGHSSQVSNYAAPQLRSEVLQAQSAQVDSVSGATYTSQAYQQSLQSALDQAGSGLGAGIAQAGQGAGATAAPAQGAGATAAPAQGAGATAAPAQGAAAAAKGSFSGQLTGNTVQTPFGGVQVQVTLQSGKITDVQTLQLPSGGHSSQVSRYAAPQLRSEVLQAQSAQVDSVSGATYTSAAYQQSLQSALDQAA